MSRSAAPVATGGPLPLCPGSGHPSRSENENTALHGLEPSGDPLVDHAPPCPGGAHFTSTSPARPAHDPGFGPGCRPPDAVSTGPPASAPHARQIAVRITPARTRPYTDVLPTLASEAVCIRVHESRVGEGMSDVLVARRARCGGPGAAVDRAGRRREGLPHRQGRVPRAARRRPDDRRAATWSRSSARRAAASRRS